MSPSPTVTILLPNYNHAQFIGRALDALVAQSRAADEILVIDDASDDGSVAVVQEYLGRLPQLRLIRNERNLGINLSMNRAIAEVRGDFIVPGGADDWLEPTFLEKMTAAIERFPQARVCVSRYVQYLEVEHRIVDHGHEIELGCWYGSGETEFFSASGFAELLNRAFVWLPINGALIHRDTFKAVGGFDPKLRWHSDWFAAYSIALRHGFAVVPEPLSVIRIAPDTYSNIGLRDRRQQRAVCVAIYDKLREPGFEDIREILRQHPAAFSPFIRYLLEGLAPRPRDWPYWLALISWWLREVRTGQRRPNFLKRLLGSLPRSS
jgi:glycosyltransferase involved in cell wall biosynthesis